MNLKPAMNRIYIDRLGRVATGRGASINILNNVTKTSKTVEKAGKSSKIKSKHMEKRTKERCISDADIEDAKQNPLHKGKVVVDNLGRKSVKYIGTNATVVINPDTNVEITSWKIGKNTRKKYSKGDKNV